MKARATIPLGSHKFDAANRVRIPRWIAVLVLTFVGVFIAGGGGTLVANAALDLRSDMPWCWYEPFTTPDSFVALTAISTIWSLVVFVPVWLLSRSLVLWRAWTVSTSLTMLSVAAQLCFNDGDDVVIVSLLVACASLAVMRFSRWQWPRRGGFAWLGDPV